VKRKIFLRDNKSRIFVQLIITNRRYKSNQTQEVKEL